MDMDVRVPSSRRAVRGDRDEKKPSKNRLVRFVIVTLGAGVLAGVGAMLGIWPFSGLQALATQIVQSNTPAMIQAQSLFPAVQPVHKTVDVYDPPRQVPARPTPPGHPSPEPSSSPKPHPSPSPGDE
jgi:hypothetical protein